MVCDLSVHSDRHRDPGEFGPASSMLPSGGGGETHCHVVPSARTFALPIRRFYPAMRARRNRCTANHSAKIRMTGCLSQVWFVPCSASRKSMTPPHRSRPNYLSRRIQFLCSPHLPRCNTAKAKLPRRSQQSTRPSRSTHAIPACISSALAFFVSTPCMRRNGATSLPPMRSTLPTWIFGALARDPATDGAYRQQKQFLATPTAWTLRNAPAWKRDFPTLIRWAGKSDKTCHVASDTSSTELPFVPILSGGNSSHVQSWGLHVAFNQNETVLGVDTGASGLIINRAIADRAGLKPIGRLELGGVGDQGPQGGYVAHVDSIRIGALEFRDCTVEVTDRKDILSMDGTYWDGCVQRLSDHLDFPMRKFLLSQLPPRPTDTPRLRRHA